MATVLVEERGQKRQRVVSSFKTKRPIDKKLIAIDKNALSDTQATTDLLQATFPCTITGLRWELSAAQDAGTGVAKLDWVMVIVRDGQTVDTIASSDGASVYNPEQDVLVFGSGIVINNTNSIQMSGSTKTMRKLMGGDKITWVARGVATNTLFVTGIIQFFCKT